MRDWIDECTHHELATLVPELLLIGQLVDRAGMPALLSEFGLDGMRDVAIEEWQAASPHYALRMKRALGITGDGVAEIFKGFQLDIGAPPEFMDFRYVVHDHDHGEFYLDHCGALMDVEPMGEGLVRTMCHDIEDPTFPATAYATNPLAIVEPIHRPPRTPEGRTPHCHWTVRIDPSATPAALPEPAVQSAGAALLTMDFPAPGLSREAEAGHLADYSGPLLSDLRFADFTRAALVRIVREVYLQIHLLSIGFHQSVARRGGEAVADRLLAYQCTGIAGVAAERLAAAFDVTGEDPLSALARVLQVHPLTAPAQYTGYSHTLSDDGGGVLELSWSLEAPWWKDECASRVLRSGDAGPIEAAARAIDPRLEVELWREGAFVRGRVKRGDNANANNNAEREEVAVTRISTGAAFEFGPVRTPLPLFPVGE